jgi:enediyne biosynthesis protein E4
VKSLFYLSVKAAFRVTMRAVGHALVWILAGSGIATWSPRSAESGVRIVALDVAASGKTGFTLLRPEQTGVTFTNVLDEWASANNRVLNNGSGVAAGDFDNDGWVDLFFCSLDQRNRLFKNLGNWQFKDVTDQAGLRFPPLFYRAAVFADLDGDGWLDLLTGTVSQGVLCFLNNQRGGFTNITAQAGTASPYANETLALADIDGNGTLDLYACNNRNDDIRDWPRVPVILVNKKPTVPPHLRDRITFENGALQEFGEPDILYLNDGRARFTAVSWTNGAFLDERGQSLPAVPLDWGLAATFRDLNNDGAPDLYVCNDYWTPDRLWINDGRGRFRAIEPLALRKIPASSMGVDFADINRDGHVDIFAVDMLSRSSELRRRQTTAKRPPAPRVGDIETRVQAPQNTLLLNRGDGTFAEIAALANLKASDWSWSPVFLDVDLDGYDDLLITAGHMRDIQDMDANQKLRELQDAWRRSPMAATNLQRAFVEAKHAHQRLYPSLEMPVVAFRNRADLRFEEVTSAWGLAGRGVNHGIALADFDNDGDLDAAVNRLGAPAAMFRNDAGAPRLAVRLRGKAPNTQAIGARIELSGGPVAHQKSEVTSGGTYMSGHDTLRVFACGAASNAFALTITWRDGLRSLMTNVQANRLYEFDEAAVRRLPADARTTSQSPLFEDLSALLSHTHQENSFDDFALQRLLPRKFSQNGPGVAWIDFNEDGWEDLIIGSGKGGQVAVLLNREGKQFQREQQMAFTNPSPRDVTTVLGWKRGPGETVLLAGSASYEDRHAEPSCVLASHGNGTGKSNGMVARFPGHTASIGSLALADADGTGNLVLFVGGQVIPGGYPKPASSLIFRYSLDQWSLDTNNTRVLADVGLVNGAVWSNLDGEGGPELILACEWGPVRVFQDRAGTLVEVTGLWGLAGFTGLWTGVTTGDFDGDGRLDIVAGNWGLNSGSHASPQQPLTILYGDIAGHGTVDILETEFDSERGQLVPVHQRDTLAATLPFLSQMFPTHLAFSRATVKDLIGDRPARQLSVATLATTVFLNRGGRFQAKALPDEAQFAPTFGVSVADFDGDGHEDVFLSQNFFAFRAEDSRLDAGRGLLLLGDGKGDFAPMSGQMSGLRIYGEQRGTAAADFDHDGRTDLVVAQNGAATKLYRNTRARPGLRLELVGPPGNPDAIGAVARVKFGEEWGPAREIHAGSGWWSQDGAVPVLAVPRPATAVWIRWPDGRTSERMVPPNGALRRIRWDERTSPSTN